MARYDKKREERERRWRINGEKERERIRDLVGKVGRHRWSHLMVIQKFQRFFFLLFLLPPVFCVSMYMCTHV